MIVELGLTVEQEAGMVQHEEEPEDDEPEPLRGGEDCDGDVIENTRRKDILLIEGPNRKE